MGILDLFDTPVFDMEPTSSIDEMEDFIKAVKEDNSNEENDGGSSHIISE